MEARRRSVNWNCGWEAGWDRKNSWGKWEQALMQRTSGSELSRRLWYRRDDDVARKEQKPTSQRSKKTGHIQGSRHDMGGATEGVPLNFLWTGTSYLASLIHLSLAKTRMLLHRVSRGKWGDRVKDLGSASVSWQSICLSKAVYSKITED